MWDARSFVGKRSGDLLKINQEIAGQVSYSFTESAYPRAVALANRPGIGPCCSGPPEPSMPLYKLLQQRVFDPELISVMAEAYERTRLTLGLADRSDKLTHLLAEKI